VRLVASDHKLSRIILITPAWAQTMAQKHPAVALALKLSPLDQYRQTVRIPPARTLPQAACA
jgi:hypothetical protein